MDDIGSIGGLDKTGQGGGSFGGYYKQVPKKQSQQTPLRLKPGEILLGRIVELKEDDIAEVKLPMGNFRAILHGKLIRGDVLFLQVVEISPSLLLKIHSVSTTFNGELRTADEVIRILDIPRGNLYSNIVEYLLASKSNILRTEVLQFATVLAQFGFNPEIHKTKPIFDAVFALLISNEQENIQLLNLIFPSFLPIADSFALYDSLLKNNEISKSFDYFGFVDLTSQLGFISYITKLKPNLLYNFEVGKKVVALNNSIFDYNRFAVSKNLPYRWLFGMFKSNCLVLFKTEYLVEKKSAYGTNDESAVSKFIANIQNTSDRIFIDCELDYSERSIIEKSMRIVSHEISQISQNFGLSLVNFEAYNPTFGLISISLGNLKAIPRNFSIVV